MCAVVERSTNLCMTNTVWRILLLNLFFSNRCALHVIKSKRKSFLIRKTLLDNFYMILRCYYIHRIKRERDMYIINIDRYYLVFKSFHKLVYIIFAIRAQIGYFTLVIWIKQQISLFQS